MKRYINLIHLFYLTLLSMANIYASGIELTNIGARATAMGGNYRSIADDWSAMYWNPAGLAFSQGWQTGMSMEYVMLRPSFRAGNSHYYHLNGGENFKSFSATFNTKRSAEPLNFIVPSFGISYSGESWSFGIGVWVPMGLGTKWNLLDTVPDNQTNLSYNTAYPEYEYENNMQVIDIHPTISYKITQKLSVGAGLSILLGKVSLRRPAYLQNPYLYNDSIYDILYDLSDDNERAILSQMREPPFDHLINEVGMTASGISLGGNIGLLYKPLHNLNIGITAHFNKEMEVTGDYIQTVYFADNPEYQALVQVYDEAVFANLKDIGAIDEQSYLVISQFYSGDILELQNIEANAKIPLPVKIGVGFSYNGIPDLILAADMSFMQWSDWGVLAITDMNGNGISELVQNWKDTFKIGIGLEYRTSLAVFRGGFSTENPAAIDATISPSIPEIGRRYNFDIGIAVPFSELMISFNYEGIFIADHEVRQWEYDSMTIAQNMAGEYAVNVNTFMIGLDYRF